MAEYPQGTITFVMTDIEGSTSLWDRHPEEMRSALARYDALFEHAAEVYHGVVVRPRGEGDSRFAVFPLAIDACRAVMAFQRGLEETFTDLPFELKTRVGIHTGAADLRMGDYYGSAVNRCARIRSLAHGGQVLLSQVTADLVRDLLLDDMSLVDLGMHRLKGLNREEHIFQLSIQGLPGKFPPLQSAGSAQHNLPASPTPFIGRQNELADVVTLLLRDDVRLVTLTGPGGTGKTRLGLEAAGVMLDYFPQGVFFVDLAPINSPDLAATTIARSMGIREGGGRPAEENLLDYLADKELLLILDNFEQIASAAPLVARLLTSGPQLKVLVTSRIVLRLRGEHEYPVLPMRLPVDSAAMSVKAGLKFEAVRLFVQQAQAVRPDFELNEENIATVVEICRRLDGLPLAIEIAAARLRLLPPQALLSRLDQSLKLLVGGPVDLPARHQTMRSVIDWSYNLLEPDVQSLFAYLSVFVGGFSFESAENICSPEGDFDILAGVDALLNSSLIVRSESSTGEPRFDMLQTIHEYAREKLAASGKRAELQHRHALHYAGQAEVMGRQLYGTDSVAWLRRIDEEHDNFRTALTWSIEQQPDASAAVQICLWLFWFWYRYGHFHEGRGWCERTLAVTQKLDQSLLHAVGLYTSALMAMWEGDLHIAANRAEESIQIVKEVGAELILSHAHFGYGVILINQGRDREAYAQLVQAAEIYDQVGYQFLKATTLVHLANAALGMGEFEEARTRLEVALPVVQELGDRWQIAFCLNNFGELARAQGDYETAQAYYLRTEASFKEADALGDQARLVHTSAYLAQHQGELERAGNLFHESLAKFRILGNRRGIAECMAGLACLAARQGRPVWAAQMLGAAHKLLSISGAAWWPADRVEIQDGLARTKASLDPNQFDRAWQAGQAMSLDEALRYTLETSASA